jgi:acyl-CoA thioesterase-2
VTASTSGASGAPAEIERLFGLDQTDEAVFTATIQTQRSTPRLFGGQVAAQALVAACRTVPDERPPHSLHAYFVRAGTENAPVHYHVDRVRDGRTFSTRHVTARQDDEVILEFLASFEHPEDGPNWQVPAPPVDDVPDRLIGSANQRLAHTVGHLDIRLIHEPPAEGWRMHPFWFRTLPAIGEDPTLNAAMVTYVSDIGLMASAREPGTQRRMSAVASIDHALWFHRPPRTDEWLLSSAEPVVNIGARGTVRGAFHTQERVLVATVAQEALLRPLRGEWYGVAHRDLVSKGSRPIHQSSDTETD